MREIPAAVRFCSYEPAIGPLKFWPDDVVGLHWLICGGESGPGYRDMPRLWESNVRDDCERAGIAYFFKQMAGKKPIPNGFPVVRQFPRVAS
jgi:protein gp37